MIQWLRTDDPRFGKKFDPILTRRREQAAGVERRVRRIIDSVRRRGDEALFELVRRYDGRKVTARSLVVPRRAIEAAAGRIKPGDRRALDRAAKRIRRYFSERRPSGKLRRDGDGVLAGERVTPLERVGIYIPGGTAAYPSTVLMTAIPARTAGVQEVVIATPGGPSGRNGAVDPHVLYAAKLAGVSTIYRMGGAHAVAALAYGTRSVRRVDKIVGPGNIYVATAKRLLFGIVDVDSVAGPSEVLILCDARAKPRFIAADLLAQAEHDAMSTAVLVTHSEKTALATVAALRGQLVGLPRRRIAQAALRSRGAVIITRSLSESVEIANRFAPEHLGLAVTKAERVLPRIRNAGAVFLGDYSPEAVGDYLAGPSHVLPTGGTARFFSPLGVEDFVKRNSVIAFSRRGLERLGRDVIRLAELEGLSAHARAVAVRLSQPRNRVEGEKRRR